MSLFAERIRQLGTEQRRFSQTTPTGASFSTPFAQCVVFVKRVEGWRAIHAHQSSLRGR